MGSVPGSGRSPGEGNIFSNILAWRIPNNRGAWRATVHERDMIEATEHARM